MSALGVLNNSGVISLPVDRLLDELRMDWPVFYDMLATPWVLGLTIAAVLLPLIGLIYGGIQLIFGFKPPKWRPGLVIFVLWLVVLVVLAVLFAMGVFSTEYLHA